MLLLRLERVEAEQPYKLGLRPHVFAMCRQPSPGVIEVEFTVARVRIRRPVDAPIVAAVMQALTDCGKR